MVHGGSYGYNMSDKSVGSRRITYKLWMIRCGGEQLVSKGLSTKKGLDVLGESKERRKRIS